MRQQHDLAVAWRIHELMPGRVPAEDHRDFFDQCYTISLTEIDTYERAKASQEARPRPGG